VLCAALHTKPGAQTAFDAHDVGHAAFAPSQA
jgi:hypothetical protein